MEGRGKERRTLSHIVGVIQFKCLAGNSSTLGERHSVSNQEDPLNLYSMLERNLVRETKLHWLKGDENTAFYQFLSARKKKGNLITELLSPDRASSFYSFIPCH